MTKKFLLDSAERVGRTLFQVYFAAWAAVGMTFENLYDVDTFKGTVVGLVLAVAMILGLKNVNHDSSTSSVVSDRP
jgi:hypothetical protein